jgi:hypothetical protein
MGNKGLSKGVSVELGAKKRETKIKKKGTNGDLEAHIRSKTCGDWGRRQHKINKTRGLSGARGPNVGTKDLQKAGRRKKHKRKKKGSQWRLRSKNGIQRFQKWRRIELNGKKPT